MTRASQCSSTSRLATTHRGDAGETLLELLISIMIIGVAVTAVLGAVLLTVDVSSLDRRQVHAQALLRSWGEHVVAQTSDATYTSCATPAMFDPPGSSSVWSYPRPTTPAGLGPLPAGFTAHVTSVEYWNGSTDFVATCGGAVGPDPDSGVQRVELTMTVDSLVYPGFSSSYEVVVRRPCVTAGAAGC